MMTTGKEPQPLDSYLPCPSCGGMVNHLFTPGFGSIDLDETKLFNGLSPFWKDHVLCYSSVSKCDKCGKSSIGSLFVSDVSLIEGEEDEEDIEDDEEGDDEDSY